MAKSKITGFARLLIFLLIFLPLAFFGASYINGEDPIAKVKGYLSGTSSNGNTEQVTPRQSSNEQTSDMEKRILTLERDLAVAKEELARCKLEHSN